MKEGEGRSFELAGCTAANHLPLSRDGVSRPGETDVSRRRGGRPRGRWRRDFAGAKAGNLCEDIAIAFFKVLAEHGIEKTTGQA